MIISCPNCTTRLQLDDAKVPQRPFTVRCPKCHHIINAQPAADIFDGSAIQAGGDLPATTRAQREAKSMPAPVFNVTPEGEAEQPVQGADADEIVRALAALLTQGRVDAEGSDGGAGRRPAWDKWRALVCVSTPHRQEIVEGLAKDQYKVFVADTTAQAIERMREDKMDVLVLDPEFDLAEQGAAFITREISALRQVERRRMIIAHLSPDARTEDAHAAFLSNVNLVVNLTDARELSRTLERTRHDLNELYKDFNRALGVSDL